LEWLVTNNVLVRHTPDYSDLADEFQRIRLMLDRPSELDRSQVERRVLEFFSVSRMMKTQGMVMKRKERRQKLGAAFDFKAAGDYD
jgi:hypothetical protein